MKKIVVLITALVVMLVLTGCSTEEPGYVDISNAELQEMLDNEETYQFVDVRTSTEYNEAHVVGFTFNIDYYQFQDDYSMLDVLDKDVPVVVMCRSGSRSANAAQILIDEGFTEVYNLENGINQWNGATE